MREGPVPWIDGGEVELEPLRSSTMDLDIVVMVSIHMNFLSSWKHWVLAKTLHNSQ